MIRKAMVQIMQDLYDNGIITAETSREEINGEFEFAATENGWTDEEIKEALESPWFPEN